MNNDKFDIRARRQELGLTLEQVASFVGVSKSTVSKWEKGQIKNMLIDKIALLARILKISPTDITGLAYPELSDSDEESSRASQSSDAEISRGTHTDSKTAAVRSDFYGTEFDKFTPLQSVNFDGVPGKLVYAFNSMPQHTHEIIYEKDNVPMVEHLTDEENQLIVQIIELIQKSRQND